MLSCIPNLLVLVDVLDALVLLFDIVLYCVEYPSVINRIKH